MAAVDAGAEHDNKKPTPAGSGYVIAFKRKIRIANRQFAFAGLQSKLQVVDCEVLVTNRRSPICSRKCRSSLAKC